MLGESRQMLRQHITNKRVNEGLEEIPDDLFAKKPRHEMSDEEYQGMLDRRKRNKEAAERSRKKKKVEFEKLQSENDQLNQDKCELVAMVQKLKSDCESVVKENDLLRSSYEHLKRWIGKRSVELGLTKYAQNDVQSKGSLTEDLPTSPLTKGNPLLYTPDSCIAIDNKLIESGRQSSPPKSAHPPKEASADHHQSVSRPQLQTPWLVDPVVKEKPALENHVDMPEQIPQQTAHLPENQPLVVANGQQVVYLPKDAIIVIQDDRTTLAGVPEPRQVVMASPKHAVEPPEAHNMELPISSNSMTSLNGNFTHDLGASGNSEDEELKETIAVETSAGIDTATATAIESLLKLGYKIKLPKAAPNEPESAQTTQNGSSNHGYEAADDMSVKEPESVSRFTVPRAMRREQ